MGAALEPCKGIYNPGCMMVFFMVMITVGITVIAACGIVGGEAGAAVDGLADWTHHVDMPDAVADAFADMPDGGIPDMPDGGIRYIPDMPDGYDFQLIDKEQVTSDFRDIYDYQDVFNNEATYDIEKAKYNTELNKHLATEEMRAYKTQGENLMRGKAAAGGSLIALGAIGYAGYLSKSNKKAPSFYQGVSLLCILMLSIGFCSGGQGIALIVVSTVLMWLATARAGFLHYHDEFDTKDESGNDERRRLISSELPSPVTTVTHRRLVTLECLLDEINAAKEASLQREVRSQWDM